MGRISFKKVSLYIAVMLSLFIIISCPEPITEDIVAKVEDEGAPTIVVSSPMNNSVYRSEVSFTGNVNDDADNSIEKVSFNIRNRAIGGGVVINSGSVSQDSSAGTIPVAYNPSSGSFSFSFSTISPDILRDSLYVDLEALDWNGNIATSTITLFENRDGEYVDLTSPAPGDVYSTVLSINATVIDQQVTGGDPISYENLKSIKYQIIGTSLLQETLTIEGATPDGGGIINSGGDLSYNTNTGELTGNISLASQTGIINFQLTVEDLNGHIESESFNISDGNVSPSVIIDSASPPEFDGKRYFKEGTSFVISGHVGPTNRDYSLFNYFADPGTGTVNSFDITPSVTITPEGLNLYEFSRTINTTGFQDTLQKVKFQFQADGSSETSTTTVFFTNDFINPSFDIAADPVTSDASYYYVTVGFDEPVWGGENFSALLSAADFAVTNTHGPLSLNSIENVTGTLSEGQTVVRLRVPVAAGNIYKDGTTEYSINTAGTSGANGIYDVANNTPIVAGIFTFPDETDPSVITNSHSPTGTISSFNYSGTVSFKFNEVVQNPGGVSGGKILINSTESSVSTIAGNGVDISVSVPLSTFTEGNNTISVPVGRFEDASGNSNTVYSWNLTKDTTPPSTTALEIKTGSDTITDGSLRGSITSDVDVIFTFADIDVAGVAGKDIILKRDGSQVTTVEASTANIVDNKATVSIPFANFGLSGAYEISIENGSFEDSYDNPCNTYTGMPFGFNIDVTPPSTTALEIKTGSDTITEGSSRGSITSDVDVIFTFADTDIAGVAGKDIILKRDGSQVTTVEATTANIVDNKATVTIPFGNFSLTGAYEISIENGAFEDSYDNPCNSYTDLPFSFSVDSVPPAKSLLNPLNNTTSVAVDSNLVITFNENISAGGGAVRIYNSSDVLVQSITVTSGMIIDDTLTINPSNFTQDTLYYVQIDSDAVQDIAGNSYAGISDKTSWTFTTGPAPGLASSDYFSPADETTSVAVGSNLVITFNENISAGGGAVRIYNSSDVLVQSITVTSGMISGDTLTINPSSDLAQDTSHYVLIDSDAVEDVVGNNYAGISDKTIWNFTTGPAPGLASSGYFSPADGTTSVAVDSNLEITFNENISAGGGAVRIYNSSDVLVQSITVTSGMISGDTLTINPSSDLAQDTSHYVLIDSDAVEDAVGNSYAGISNKTIWTFTTGPAPGLASSGYFSPANGTTSVAVDSNLEITFNENIAAGTGDVKIYKASADSSPAQSVTVTSGMISGDTLTINPSSDLAQDTLYYVLIDSGAVEDTVGNSYAGISGKTIWTFTTGPAPELASTDPLSPSDGSSSVGVDSSFTATFNENITAGGGDVEIYSYSPSTLVESITVTSGMISGDTLTINPSSNLTQNKNHYIKIDSDALKDSAGNFFAGISSYTTWNFETGSIPVIDSSSPFSPADNATAVAKDINIVITFNEDIVAGTGAVVIYNSSDTLIESITVASGMISGKTLTINPSADFNPNTGYYVFVDSDAVKDSSGNFFAGISDKTVWNFETGN